MAALSKAYISQSPNRLGLTNSAELEKLDTAVTFQAFTHSCKLEWPGFGRVCVSIYHLSTGTEWRLALTSKCSSVFHKAFCASSCKLPKTQVGFQKGQVSPNAACLMRSLCFGTNGLLFQDLVMSHDSVGLIGRKSLQETPDSSVRK